MSRKQVAWWQRHHDRGRLRFVIVSGVVLWGGLSTALWMALMWFSVSEEYFRLTFFSRPVRLILVVAVAGALFGLLTWEMNEFRYRLSLSKRKDGDAAK